MTDQSSLPSRQGNRPTTMYRPTAEGGLEAAPDEDIDYRVQLRSDRWNAAPLENAEVDKSDPRLVLLGVAILSAITLVVLVLGYSSGFWN